MNARERFLNTLNGKEIDRFFRYELGLWPSTQKRWQKSGMPEKVSFEEYFDFDGMIRLPVRSGYTDSPFYPLFDRIVIEEGTDWEIIRDTDGITKKLFKQDPDLSMPQFIKFPVESRKEWEKVLKHLDPGNAPNLIGDLDSLSWENRDKPVTLTACGAFGHPRNLFGDVNLFYAMFDDPDFIKEILINWYEIYREIFRLVCKKIKVDCLIVWEDMCYKNGPLISPHQFKEFLLPHYSKLTAFARECGIDSIWVDSDGDVLKLIPLFLEAGVDAIMPFEVQAGMDVAKIRKEYGSSFTIIGGIDKRALTSGRVAIKKEVDRVLPYFMETGRYIPSLDHTVPVNVSLDNFRYYLECVRAYE